MKEKGGKKWSGTKEKERNIWRTSKQRNKEGKMDESNERKDKWEKEKWKKRKEKGEKKKEATEKENK